MILPVPFWYLITPDDPDDARWRERVAAALPARPDLVQYRNKAASPQVQRAQVRWLVKSARAFGILPIVNDDVALAAELGASAHLGRDDGDLAAARARLGPGAMLGASAYDSLARAEAAVAAGASYVAFGAVYPSGTKPNAVRAPLSLFVKARRLGVPLVAIGGVTLDRVPELLAAGADGVAVIGDVFAHPDVAARARAWGQAFAAWRA